MNIIWIITISIIYADNYGEGENFNKPSRMKMKISGNIVLFAVGIIILGYFFMFLKSKQYLKVDFFQGGQVRQGITPLKTGDSIPVKQDAGADPWTKPYTTDRIMKVDDYDHDIVRANEGDREYSDAEINAKTTQRPFDWPGLPPSAAKFQTMQQQWMVDVTRAEPAKVSIYKDIEGFAIKDGLSHKSYNALEGFSVLPPDYDKMEADEQKLLKTYAPACSKDLKYDIDDAKDLINKIYAKRGEIPMIDVRDDGVYEVYETKESNPKIIYDDDAEAATVRASPADFAEAKFTVPQAATDIAAGLDPFFEPGDRSRDGRSNYNTWTPGLERAFAPNVARANWY